MEVDAAGKTALDLALTATTVPAPRVVQLLRERMRSKDGDALCGSCEENAADVVFKPCGCRVACEECSRRWKKCIRCKAAIEDKEKVGVGVSTTAEAAAGGQFRGRPSTASLTGLYICFLLVL